MAKRRKSKRLVAVLVSDTHTGHSLGLLNPATELVDEHGEPYSPSLNKTQAYLWHLYNEHLDAVADLADGCRVIAIVNGDVTQGDRYPAHLCLPLIADQIVAASWTLQPLYVHKRLNLSHVRVIVGTGVHGWEGSAAALVAQRLASQHPQVDTRALYHASIALTGQRGQVIDAAHHGPFPGSRKWLKGSIAVRYVTDAMLSELADGHTPPRVYARAHYHEYLHVGPVRVRAKGKDVESDLVITPSYSGIDDYVRKVTRSTRTIDHGLVALVFDDGLREVVPLYQELDMRTREAL